VPQLKHFASRIDTLGDDKENNSLFLMTWKLKRSTTGANTKPNSKKCGLTNSHLHCATTGTAQHKRDSGRRLFSMADSMMLTVVQVALSCNVREYCQKYVGCLAGMIINGKIGLLLNNFLSWPACQLFCQCLDFQVSVK
jgi:hypothetical protein